MTAVLPAPSRQIMRDLVRPLDPVVSLYLGLVQPTPTADTTEDVNLRWRAISAELVAHGAEHATVKAVARHLESIPIFPIEVAIFAEGERVLLHQELPGGVPFDRARFAAPAQLAPLLSWLQRHPPHVIVVTDRTGADVTIVGDGAATGVTESVVGPDDEIERNAPGGWAQPRFQRRAEDSWRHNAAAVADVTIRALHKAGADLLLLGGDARALQLLEERLRDHRNPRVTIRHIPGGRHADGSALARHAAVTELVANHAAQRMAAVLDRFAEERGPHGRAIDGVAGTLTALAVGQVDTLIIVDDPRDERTAWFAPDLLCVADSTQTAGPVEALRSGRLVDVAVRAALLTDADVCVIDPTTTAAPAEHIGALRRFA